VPARVRPVRIRATHWRAPGAKLSGRNTLAALDFAEGSLVLTEAGTKRRASLHIVAGEQGSRAMDWPRTLDELEALKKQ
jgi:hypothetical protein